MKLDESQSVAPVTSIAFQDDQPFLVSVSLGSGRCFWMTSSCDDADSNLPSLPVFLPLIQRMMTTALRWPAGWQETPLGENWVEGAIALKKQETNKLSVQLPGDSLREVAFAKSNPTDSAASIELGTGRLEGIGQAMAGDVRFYHGFAMSTVDRKQELNRTLLGPEELESIAKSASASVHNHADQWLDQERSASSGKELWTWFWLGLLAMFFAEMFLQQSLSPRSSKKAAPAVPGSAVANSKRGAA